MELNYTGKQGELNFEKDLVSELLTIGWEKEVINNPTEKDLILNWKNIIFDNNKAILNDIPLSDSEMGQIMEYVYLHCRTPVKANIFINGKNICIRRDSDSKDKIHAGKDIYLNIFSPEEIAGGKTRYQIVEQPIFQTSSEFNDRRGDVMLLINGIPVIHIELKASGVPLVQATNQIKKYAKEGAFSGIFSLIQVFFAMTPEDVVYFANPGEYTKYNEAFFFHWGNKNNIPIKSWKEICKGENSMLSIPEAHQLIGYYTVASKGMDSLMVMRSYQYHAIRAIIQRVKKQNWGIHNQLGGYVWCTTGGGKTLTSFKAGQLIIDKCLADKVIFVVDRIELNNQSLEEYNSFQREGEEVQETTSSYSLFVKLKSKNLKDSLIVTSLQKLNKINEDNEWNRISDLDYIKSKRIIFIIDEAHRSQFGEMHERIKQTFSTALFFGFTGTPIFSKNKEERKHTTEGVFGNCLSVYSIADGIRDKNVLGFDPTGVSTYKDKDLKEKVALIKCNSSSFEEVKKDPEKFKEYKRYLSMPMGPVETKDELILDFIEKHIPPAQYDNDSHRNAVIDNILENWDVLSTGVKGTKFHAILATRSIPEACAYYKLFKKRHSGLKITALFDPNIDNNGLNSLNKEDAIIEIVNDYNIMFDQHFDRTNDPYYKKFKQDVLARLSHKKQYKYINVKGDKETLDMVIVVDQLLTGFDSKFINTLYLDKTLEEDNMIQAISRTNRIYDNEEKPFGIFKFYRKPYTMKFLLDEALRLYCEGEPDGVLVRSMEENISEIKLIFENIKYIFENENIDDFSKLPESKEGKAAFRKEFNELYFLMNSIKLQGFNWNKNCSICKNKEICTNEEECPFELPFNIDIYNTLIQRHNDDVRDRNEEYACGFDLSINISELAIEKIDSDYLESHFQRVIPIIISTDTPEHEKDIAIKEFEKELPKLSTIDQKYAKEIITDIRDGTLIISEEKTLRNYISEYKESDLNQRLEKEAELFGLDKKLLKDVCHHRDIYENNRFKKLRESADKEKTINFFNSRDGKKYSRIVAETELRKELLSFISSIKKDFLTN